jgi:hypothetical protein
MIQDINEFGKHFLFEGEFSSGFAYGNGHINDTYKLEYRGNNCSTKKYILQKINHHVFKDPEKLMNNIELVTAHLQKKVVEQGGDPDRETLTLIPTVQGTSYYKTDDDEFWRAYKFIENAQAYEIVENPNHVHAAAQAFGKFQTQLSDFPLDKLSETIPDFHHTGKRFQNFLTAVEEDVANRAASSKAEIEFVQTRVDYTNRLIDLVDRGEIPERITHNDTKFNNVMIDQNDGTGICVIDLDTVMPGLSLYDFGDSIRSMANTADESEQDLSKVQFDMEVFARFTEGYLGTAGSFLTPKEIEQLPFSAILMTFECGMRFLTDHLQGDIYFKTHRKNHNLDRCLTQFKLVSDMESLYDDMVKIVEKYDRSFGGA